MLYRLVLLAVFFVLASPQASGADLVKVTVGTTGSQSDAALDIAVAKGYFRDQGLDVGLQTFDSAANMVTLLAEGQLDVAGGNVSAGLFNAIDRGADLKIVADKSSEPPGYGYSALLVRKALYDTGKVRSVRDLRGLKIAAPAIKSNLLEYALEKGGLTLRDVQEVVLGFPDHAVALANGSVDAAITAEPWVTKILQSGTAVRLMSGDVIDPGITMTSIIYGGPFMKKEPEAARRFMIAYLRGVRYYYAALHDGHIAGRDAEAVISILSKYTGLDPSVYRSMTPSGVDPNGRVNLESLARDLQFYKSFGLVKGSVSVDQVVDMSYVDAALKVVGPYRTVR
jgi:NitT/TauT family transport system substrate-binding protein